MVTDTASSGTRQRRDRRRQRGRRPRPEEAPEGPELIERTGGIRRVSKVHKGGRHLTFRALVVMGDGNGKVGAALGRAAAVPEAVRKGRQRAESNMRPMVLKGNTIPHEVTAKFGAAKVVLLPAAPGTGVIAGGGIRAVLEAVGVEDVLSKNYGSRNPVNTVRATIKALGLLRDPRAERARRLGYKYEPEADTAEGQSSEEQPSPEAQSEAPRQDATGQPAGN